jgi:glucosamine-6-phosphate deaminase
MLQELVKAKVDWSRVTVFHLDEYIGIPETHPASFRKYLRERFVELVHPAAFYAIDGEADPQKECARLNKIIRKHPIEVAFVGIGENGHLAFNDPPADFDTREPFIVVELDEACRRQQMGEGWFPTLEDVPQKAISMSIRQIMKSSTIICSVPDGRKARAVKNTLEEPVSQLVPASILTTHKDAHLFLDQRSASLLKQP